ncbi:beta-lactamase family protein [Planomonospora sp. ID67723]|uniref:serine hydrolase domain-containing protein n=1 Tax=Planomonospora sp. ID67723 TaxID=2738134 RepID=UPI0018C42F48|nr:serine hydrolase domain-containing protein [Planomonospora sp. ID67723]MBG0826450.1 beta-lactamase family protein [Planomonospora sp. ID67723]
MNWRIGARMHALVRAYARLGRFSGSVLAARGERVLLSKGYGLASHEHGLPNTPRTAFRIGSQTKTFTAIAILQLQERGMLDVGLPLEAVLPGYPGGDRITLHHLLTNTSGIPDYITTEDFTRIMGLPRTPEELIASFRDRPALFAPGARMSYSNSGWVLLGAVIERLTGQSYGGYVQREILTPLGMDRSGLGRHGDVLPGHAEGYMSQDGQVGRTPYLDNSNQYAAGALHATAEDMLAWVRGLKAGAVLGRASLKRLVTPYVDGYAYGCTSSGDRVESSGGTIGYVSVTAHYPADDLTVIVLSNFENAAYAEIEAGLAAIARGEPYEPPGERVFVPADPAVFDSYVGRYECSFMGRTSTIEVTAEGESLMVEVHGLKKTELRPMSRTHYFARMKGEVELTFVGEPAREIAMLWSGHEVTAHRIA